MSTNVLVPGADIVPSVTSRIVTIDTTDMLEGAPKDGTVTFILPRDLHVAADNKIIQAGSQAVTLVNGHGEIRLPTYDPDAVTEEGSSDWAILVKKSWSRRPYPYAIRVPAGTGNISLASLTEVRPLTARERAYAITGTSVQIVEGAAWNATVALINGILSFSFTAPPSDTLRWWKVVHRDFTTGTNFDTMTDPGIWSTRDTAIANSLVNSPTTEPVMLRNEWGGIKADGTPTFTVQTVTTTSANHAPIVWQRNVWSTGSKSAWAQRGDIGARLVEVADTANKLGTGMYGVLSSRNIAAAPPGESGGLSEIKVGDAAWVQMWQRWTATGAIDLLTRSNSPTATGTWQRPESPRAVEWARQQMQQIAAATTQPRTDGTFPSNSWSAPAALQPLGIPTPDGSGQATHPSVWDMGPGQTYGGHRYWMAYTPYKYANDALEDPCVAWSDNGAAWTAATGAFPLDDAPGGASFNSDTDLTITGGAAYVLWRAVESGVAKLYWRTSTNGSTWTAKTLIWDGGISLFSPSMVKTASGWRMYFVGGGAGARKVGFMDSTLATPTPASWTAPTWVTTPLPTGREPWHLEVKQHAGRWWGTLTDTLTGQNGVQCRIRLMQSADGTNWDVAQTELVPGLGHSHDNLYRASIAYSGTANAPTMDMWYSGLSADKGWWIYRTTPTKVDPVGSTGGASTIAQVTGLQAALDAKVTQATLANPDADTITTPGSYAITASGSSLNLPEKVTGRLDVIGTTYLVQQFTTWHNTSPITRTWLRARNSSATGWTRWVNTSWASPLSLQSGADLNTETGPGSYVIQSSSVLNKPTAGLGVLEVMRFNDTTLVQRFTPFNMSTPQIYMRSLSGTTWQPWASVSWWAGLLPRYVDLDTLTTPQVWNVQWIDHPQQPVARVGTLTVTTGGTVIVQRFDPATGDLTPLRRTKGSGAWSAWELLAPPTSTTVAVRAPVGTWTPTLTARNSADIAHGMTRDRTIMLNGSHAFGALKSSTDGGLTWTTVHTFPDTAYLWSRELDNGELLVCTGKDPNPRSLWVSTGWRTGTVTFTKVLDAVAPYAYFSTGWGLSIHKNIVVAAEYGPKTGGTWNGITGLTDYARRVWLSLDFGKTWRQVFDLGAYLTGRGQASTDDQHLHGVAWDPWWDRLWVSFGDATNGVVYSDDLGATWQTADWNGVPNGGWQAVGILPLPGCVLLASDGYPNGVWRINRSEGRKLSGTYTIETAYTIPGSQPAALQYLCHAIHRVPQEGGDLYLFGFGAETEPAASCIVATRDGRTFWLLWQDSEQQPSGRGLRTITGPTMAGELIVGSNDTRAANMWSEWRGSAPIY